MSRGLNKVMIIGRLGRTPEMRYRPEYSIWGVILDIELNTAVVSHGQMAMMFEVGGHGVGIGDYRPEKDGDCGTFQIVDEGEFKKWRQRNKL